MRGLREKIRDFTLEFQQIWYKTYKDIPNNLVQCEEEKQIANERNLEIYFEKIYTMLMSFPKEVEKRELWGQEVNAIMDEYIETGGFINKEALKYLFSKNIKSHTKEFYKRAKNFDNSLPLEEIGQAIRNVWIMNILQVIFNEAVELTPSIFAYSMLYPYTDNFLDDEYISLEYKNYTNNKLRAMLRGEPCSVETPHEEKLKALVSLIEGQYDRGEYTEVYKSLLAIEEAQSHSTKQQGNKVSPYEEDILNISFIKGGTSVLADGYLVKGKLKDEEIKFLLGYGIMLQLCDDLQDIKEDSEKNHNTIFSITAVNWELDLITNKLMHFVNYIIEEELSKFEYPMKVVMNSFIRDNCLMLVYSSLIKSKDYFSKEYINNIEKLLPFRVQFIRSFQKKLRSKLKKLRAKYDEDSFMELVEYL